MRSVVCSCVSALLFIGSVSPAYSQTDPDSGAASAKDSDSEASSAPGEAAEAHKAEAAAKYREGIELFQNGKTNRALPMFQQALQLTDSPNARLMVALCHKDLGHLAEAYRQLQRTIRDAAFLNDPKYEKTLETAQTELSALHARVGLIAISLADTPPGLAVAIDGKPLSDEHLAEPIALEPGKHEVVASAEGRETVTREVLIQAGHTKTLELKLEAPSPQEAEPEPEPEPEPPPPPPPPKPGPRGTPLRTAGYVVAGVGGAGLLVFATTGLMAKSKYNSVDDACGGSRCTDPKYADDIDSGKSLQTVANVSLAVGTLAVLAGSALIVFGGPSQSEQPAVSASPLPGGGYVGYTGRF